MKKGILIAVLIVIIIGISLFAWKLVQPKADIQNIPVTIAGLKGPSSVGMIKLFEDKPGVGENLESKYEVVQTPDIMVSKMHSKEVDFAALPTNVAAMLYNKGMDYKLAAISGWGVLYILTTEDDIEGWADLKGKEMNAIDKGSNPDVVLKYLLSKNNLKPDTDVILDYTLGHIELAESMAAGKIKTAILPEPFVTMVMMKNKNVKVILNLQDEWKKVNSENTPFAQTCLVVKGEFAQNHPQAVEKLLEEYKNSINWVNNNKVSAGVLIEKHGIGFKANIAQEAIPRCNLRFEDAKQSEKAVKAFLKVIFDFSPKDLGGKLPDENFYYKK